MHACTHCMLAISTVVSRLSAYGRLIVTRNFTSLAGLYICMEAATFTS